MGKVVSDSTKVVHDNNKVLALHILHYLPTLPWAPRDLEIVVNLEQGSARAVHILASNGQEQACST